MPPADAGGIFLDGGLCYTPTGMNLEMTPFNIVRALAVAGAAVAMVTDMRTGKIFNWLTFPLMFVGWGLNAYWGGLAGFGWSFLGTLLGIFLYMGFAAVGAIGMGDVKLMGAVGALCGSGFVLAVFLFTSAVGIPHALLIQYLNHGKNAWAMLAASFSTKAFLQKTIQNEAQHVRWRFYLGIDILLGVILAWWWNLTITW